VISLWVLLYNQFGVVDVDIFVGLIIVVGFWCYGFDCLDFKYYWGYLNMVDVYGLFSGFLTD
jgi:hypothetical protein